MNPLAIFFIGLWLIGAGLDLILWPRGAASRARARARAIRAITDEGISAAEAARMVDDSPSAGWHQVFFWIVFALALSPMLVGMLYAEALDWRIRPLPAFLAVLVFIVLLLWAGVRWGRGQVPVGGFGGRHPRVIGAFLALGAAALFAFDVGFGADLLVSWDQLQVTITSTESDSDGLSVFIYTTGGKFQTTLFWTPDPSVGPARLTLGHFSRQVVRIEPID